MISLNDRLFRQRLFVAIVTVGTLFPLLLHYLTGISRRSPSAESSFIFFMGTSLLFGTLFVGCRLVLVPNHIRVGRTPKAKMLGISVFKALSVVFSGTTLGYMLLDILPGSPPPLRFLASSLLPLINKGYGGPALFTFVTIVSIIFSEIIFRGFWLNFFSRRLSFSYALPLSAFIYALVHLYEPAGAITLLFFAGLAYGMVYRLYGLYVSLTTHLIFDGVVLLHSQLSFNESAEFFGRYLLPLLVTFFVGVCLFLYDLLSKRVAPDRLDGSSYEKMYGAN